MNETHLTEMEREAERMQAIAANPSAAVPDRSQWDEWWCPVELTGYAQEVPTVVLELCEEVRRLRAALAWYADSAQYDLTEFSTGFDRPLRLGYPTVSADKGARARAALTPAPTREVMP